MSTDAGLSGRRGQRRSSRRHDTTKPKPFANVPFAQPRYRWDPLEIITSGDVKQIHEASMQMLERTGVRFLDAEALSLWEEAGARVDHAQQQVYIGRDLLLSLIAKAPSSFTMRARNPAHSIIIGDDYLTLFPNGGMVNISSQHEKRRPGCEADVIRLLKLTQQCPMIHAAGELLVAMHDVPIAERHLRGQYNGYLYSDKVMFGRSHGRVIVEDTLKMARMVFGDDLITGGPVTGGVVNANSPLTFDDRMLGGLISFSRAGQVTVVTPFILAGAMSPASILAAVAQNNAEALAGIALGQLVRPGTPMIYGGFTTNINLRSGAPAFGTPEGAWALLIGAQMARYYHLPYRGSGSLNVANTVDAQAASESMWTLWPAVQAHSHLLIHALGWLEGGLTVSLEKFILDAENLAKMQYFLQGLSVRQEDFVLDMVDEVGSGGHHFATAHTMENYKDAFYEASVAEMRNFEAWEEAGSPDIVTRAHEVWQELERHYEPPPLDSAIQEGLKDFVAQRASELQGVNLYD